MLVISNTYAELTNSVRSYSEVELPLHHQLSGGFSFQFNYAISKVADYINKRRHPFTMEGVKILHNFAIGQKVPTDNAENILNFLNHGFN